MPTTKMKTQPTGWLRKDPSRVRLQRDHDDAKVVGTIAGLTEDEEGDAAVAEAARAVVEDEIGRWRTAVPCAG